MTSVLTFYNYFTPAYKAGGPIQSLDAMVKALEGSLSFSIFCSNKDHDGSQLSVRRDTWLPYNKAEVFYASPGFLRAANITNLIKQKQPTLLFLNGLYSWHFNMLPLLKTKGIRKIVSVRGMLHPGALSQKAFKKKLYLGAWKLLGLHKKCEFHATTIEEKSFIELTFGSKVKTWVAGNFPKVLDYQVPPQKEQRKLVLASVALVSPMKNHLVVLEALKNVTSNIEYHIYGPIKDRNYWNQCEGLITTLPSNIKVQYKGEVIPDKIPSALADAHVFILPSKSENFGHAIYEAMTAGKPIITSHNTPWHNLQESNAGINVSIQQVKEITSAIEFFASMENTTLVDWSKSAREYALQAIDVETIKQQYIDMFEGGEREAPTLKGGKSKREEKPQP